jgi:hypothetical protein
MKRPTSSQYFFASDWPPRIWLAAGSVVAVIATLRACEPSAATCTNWLMILVYVVMIVLSSALGFFVAAVGWVFVLGPVYESRGRANGAPFKKGDVVQILAGPYKGRITTVYSTWQRDTVRVVLGPQEEETYRDVFGPASLLREYCADASQRTGQ